MSDIVERLRDQGKDAFAKHYSLGMFKLCAEAADEIERQRAIIIAFVAAYELQDADNLTDEMRDVYATAYALSPADHIPDAGKMVSPMSPADREGK